MKTLILAFVGALALSTGAATGVAVSRNRAAVELARVRADSVHAADSAKVTERVIGDSAASHALPHDSASVADSAKGEAPKASTPVIPSPQATAPAAAPVAPKVDATPAGAAAVKPTARVASSAKVPGDSVVGLSEKRIAKAFASMAPKDAAKVFEVMSDADVGLILASLSDKESGAILSKLPPERVAALSRASLRSHGGAK